MSPSHAEMQRRDEEKLAKELMDPGLLGPSDRAQEFMEKRSADAVKELRTSLRIWNRNNHDFTELTIDLALKLKALKDACYGNNQAFNKALESVKIKGQKMLSKDDRSALLIIAKDPAKWREKLSGTHRRSWQHIVRDDTPKPSKEEPSVRQGDENGGDEADEEVGREDYDHYDYSEMEGAPLKPKEADAFMGKVADLLDLIGNDAERAYDVALTFGPDQDSWWQLADLKEALDTIMHHMSHAPRATLKKPRKAT